MDCCKCTHTRRFVTLARMYAARYTLYRWSRVSVHALLS